MATCKCSEENNNESIPRRSSSGPSAPLQKGPRRLRRSWPRHQTWCRRCWAWWRRGKSSAHLCSRAVCEMAGTGSTLQAFPLDRVLASKPSYWTKFLRICRLVWSPLWLNLADRLWFWSDLDLKIVRHAFFGFQNLHFIRWGGGFETSLPRAGFWVGDCGEIASPPTRGAPQPPSGQSVCALGVERLLIPLPSTNQLIQGHASKCPPSYWMSCCYQWGFCVGKIPQMLSFSRPVPPHQLNSILNFEISVGDDFWQIRF